MTDKKLYDFSISPIWPIFKREFFTLVGSASAWVFLVIFLVSAGFLTFMVSDLLGTGQADLTPFFDWIPWLFFFVIPALGMPLWSEERRSNTLELTLSYPVSICQMVIGKYLAGLALVFLSLILTLGIPLSVACYGKPDWNAIFCSYLGAIMAGSVFLAVSCFCSALTKSQTAAFLLSLFLCGLLLLCGADRVSAHLANYLPSALCRGIEYFSLLPHYQAFQRGLIDTSEIAYCILTTILFLYFNGLALKFTTSGVGSLFLPGALSDRYTWRHLGFFLFGFLFALYAFLCLNYGAETFAVRFDITADKAYSITPETKEFVSSLKQEIEIRFYLSESKSEETRPLQQYGKRVEWLLRDLEKSANGKIRLSVIHPEQDSAQEEAAQLDGLIPVSKNQSGDRFYLGIAISNGPKNYVMSQLSQNDEMFLEYELVRNIIAIQRDKKPLIGIMSPFPIMDAPAEGSNMRGTKALSFFVELQRNYKIINIPLDTKEIPSVVDGDKIEAVIVLQPAGIDGLGEYALDQYLMRGGKLLVFLDPMLPSRQANLTQQGLLEANRRSHASLPRLTKGFGVKFDETQKSADMNFRFTQRNKNGMQQAYPDVLCITADGISRDNPITQKLTKLLMVYPGSFEIMENHPRGLEYDVLVHTTPHSASYPVKTDSDRIFMDLRRKDPRKGKELPLVLSIRGQFQSAFSEKDDVTRGTDSEHLEKSSGTPQVILMADVDMIMKDTNYRFDQNGQRFNISENADLIQNALETLCGSENLSKLRTRKALSRPLDKIVKKRKEVEEKFSERYEKLLQEYQARSRQMSIINSKVIASGGAYRLSDSERIAQSEYYRAAIDFQREEKNIRGELNAGLNEINAHVRLVNIVIIPGFIILLAIIWFTLRTVVRKTSMGTRGKGGVK